MGGKTAKKKTKMFLVATNIVTSRPPERQPTGTSTARANFIKNYGRHEKQLTTTNNNKVALLRYKPKALKRCSVVLSKLSNFALFPSTSFILLLSLLNLASKFSIWLIWKIWRKYYSNHITFNYTLNLRAVFAFSNISLVLNSQSVSVIPCVGVQQTLSVPGPHCLWLWKYNQLS